MSCFVVVVVGWVWIYLEFSKILHGIYEIKLNNKLSDDDHIRRGDVKYDCLTMRIVKFTMSHLNLDFMKNGFIY